MIVPFNKSPRQASAMPSESPPDVFLAMAAAQMHSLGRLFEPPDEADSKFKQSIDSKLKDPGDENIRSPLEVDKGTSAKDEMTPKQMQSQGVKPPVEAIYDDSGKIVDIDTKPRKKK